MSAATVVTVSSKTQKRKAKAIPKRLDRDTRPTHQVSVNDTHGHLEMQVYDYSDRAFVLRGDTLPFCEKLTQLGGYFNHRLIGGGGWVFSKARHHESVIGWLQSLTNADGSAFIDEQKEGGVKPISARELIRIAPTVEFSDVDLSGYDLSKNVDALKSLDLTLKSAMNQLAALFANLNIQ